MRERLLVKETNREKSIERDRDIEKDREAIDDVHI